MTGQRYMHRDRQLLNLAHRLNDCQIQIPDICTGYMVDGCVPCHGNGLNSGRGSGLKSHDLYHAAGCNACHQAIDYGTALSRDDKFFYWARGFMRTMLEYFKRGWVGRTE